MFSEEALRNLTDELESQRATENGESLACKLVDDGKLNHGRILQFRCAAIIATPPRDAMPDLRARPDAPL